ncbi:hypothetical protein [Streptomyces longwoodensis]|uniref:hypothetical protein n=1 Tax=Streptomyces longwoodensis TaxID=68231 RepID=UPI0036F66D9F
MSPKPTAQRRRDRRALLDNLLSRMLRGRLTAAEAALLAESVREEQRAYDQTRRSLAETGTAYGKHRAAAADAIREPEQRAVDAEEQLGAYRAVEAHRQAAADTFAGRLSAIQQQSAEGIVAGVEQLQQRAAEAEAAASRSEQAAEDHRGAVSYALGLGYGASWAVIHERARQLRDADESAREGWEEAAQQRARATGWRAHAIEADDQADRHKAAWRSARRRAAEHLAEQQRVRGWCAHWNDRARAAEPRAERYRLAWLAARRDRKADRAAMAADLPAVEAGQRALAVAAVDTTTEQPR